MDNPLRLIGEKSNCVCAIVKDGWKPGSGTDIAARYTARGEAPRGSGDAQPLLSPPSSARTAAEKDFQRMGLIR